MKPRKREIEIFNMSVLDLLTGALGAFCFLTLALFPFYFSNTAHEHRESKAKAELAALTQKIHDQLAHLKPASTKPQGMPPFESGVLKAVDPVGELCGKMRITNYSGPGGHGSLSFVPSYAQGAYAEQFSLFMITPGRYHITMTAYSPESCTVILSVNGPSATRPFQLTQNPQQYVLSMTVSAGDLETPSVASQ